MFIHVLIKLKLCHFNPHWTTRGQELLLGMRNLSWCCVSEIWRRNVETVLQQLETGLELLIKNTALLMISENENSIYVRPCLVVKTLEAQSKKKSSHPFDHDRVDMTRLKSVKIFKPEIAHFFIRLWLSNCHVPCFSANQFWSLRLVVSSAASQGHVT